MQLTDICGKQTRLALSGEGTLWKEADGEWTPLGFNETYAGYYPACVFTALTYTRSGFVAAGLDERGAPHVFRSLLGGVWNETQLLAALPEGGYARAEGRINAILSDDAGQIFLLCEDGILVTLPDCPKCVKLMRAADEPLLGGRIEGSAVVICTASGEIRVPYGEAAQYRVSYGYAAQKLARGGVLIDMRIEPAGELPVSPKTLRAVPETVCETLEGLERDGFIAFVCDFGSRADTAAAYARAHGYRRAASLGGARPGMHTP